MTTCGIDASAANDPPAMAATEKDSNSVPETLVGGPAQQDPENMDKNTSPRPVHGVKACEQHLCEINGVQII